MKKGNYEKWTVEAFGRQLIKTNDLDPIYVALYSLLDKKWSRKKVEAWMLAYWCFYHAGVASYLCDFEADEYWDNLLVAAANETLSPVGKKWPRAAERRHFRGPKCVKAVKDLWAEYPGGPHQMIEYLSDLSDGTQYKIFADRVKDHYLFGNWISFKIVDMLETVLGVPVDFTHSGVFMFQTPAQAAIMVWQDMNGYARTTMPKEHLIVIQASVDYLTQLYADKEGLTAPPRHNRPVGIQEVETVLCKWKSHMNGHYPLFNDIDEINDGLHEWRFNQNVEDFLEVMPQRPA